MKNYNHVDTFKEEYKAEQKTKGRNKLASFFNKTYIAIKKLLKTYIFLVLLNVFVVTIRIFRELVFILVAGAMLFYWIANLINKKGGFRYTIAALGSNLSIYIFIIAFAPEDGLIYAYGIVAILIGIVWLLLKPNKAAVIYISIERGLFSILNLYPVIFYKSNAHLVYVLIGAFILCMLYRDYKLYVMSSPMQMDVSNVNKSN